MSDLMFSSKPSWSGARFNSGLVETGGQSLPPPVKWVDRVEFTSQPGKPVAERIARTRLQQL